MTERTAQVTRTPTVGLQQVVDFAYDGALVTRATWSGAAVGQWDYRYDSNFQLVGLRLDNGTETTINRNADGNVIAWGPFSITRDGPSGAPSSITSTALELDLSYDSRGRRVGRTTVVAGIPVHQVTTVFDASGMVTAMVETVGGGSDGGAARCCRCRWVERGGPGRGRTLQTI